MLPINAFFIIFNNFLMVGFLTIKKTPVF